jgi:hypothetical protein
MMDRSLRDWPSMHLRQSPTPPPRPIPNKIQGTLHKGQRWASLSDFPTMPGSWDRSRGGQKCLWGDARLGWQPRASLRGMDAAEDDRIRADAGQLCLRPRRAGRRDRIRADAGQLCLRPRRAEKDRFREEAGRLRMGMPEGNLLIELNSMPYTTAVHGAYLHHLLLADRWTKGRATETRALTT